MARKYSTRTFNHPHYKSLSLDTILKYINPLHISKCYFPGINFNNVLRSSIMRCRKPTGKPIILPQSCQTNAGIVR